MVEAVGRVCLVTGSSRGLGLAVAQHLAAGGDTVHVVHTRAAVAGDLAEQFPGRVHRIKLDGPATAGELLRSVLERDQRLDILVHAVGPYLEASLESTGPERFRSLLEGNLLSAVDLMDAARGALRATRGRAVFFGVAGLAGQRARRTNAAYVSAKAALRSYTRSLALEEAPFGVGVNMVSPGVIPHPGASSDTQDPKVQAQVPQGRPGRPSDVAATVAFLCSPEAEHLVGQDVEVAGGYML